MTPVLIALSAHCGVGALLLCVGGNHPPDQSQWGLEICGPCPTPSECGLWGAGVGEPVEEALGCLAKVGVMTLFSFSWGRPS